MVADGLADQQTAGVLERLTNLFPARNLTNAGMSGVVLENHEIAGEKRPVRPAEIEQHAVATGDGNHLKLGYQGRGHSCSPCVDRAGMMGSTQRGRRNAVGARAPRASVRLLLLQRAAREEDKVATLG